MTIIHTVQSHIQGSSTFEREKALKIPEPIWKNSTHTHQLFVVFDFTFKKQREEYAKYKQHLDQRNVHWRGSPTLKHIVYILWGYKHCNFHFHNLKPQVAVIWLLKDYSVIQCKAVKGRHTVSSLSAMKIMRRLFNQATWWAPSLQRKAWNHAQLLSFPRGFSKFNK